MLQHVGRKVQQKKEKLVSRAVPSAAASDHQSSFFDVPGENDLFYKKKDGTSLFSAVKREYPLKDIYIQVMGGGK